MWTANQQHLLYRWQVAARAVLVADAAIDVLAEGGLRGLTHRAVDACARLPQGSTANLFPTRSALLGAVLARLVESEQGVVDGLHPQALGAATPAALLELLAAGVADALDAGRARTLARAALHLEARRSPELAEQLKRSTRYWWDYVGDTLAQLGVPQSRQQARLLLAYIDGVISDQLTWPEASFSATTAIAPALDGIIHTGRPQPASPPPRSPSASTMSRAG